MGAIREGERMKEIFNREVNPAELPPDARAHLADLEAVNAGKIDFAEFQRRQYFRQKNSFLPRLITAKNAGDWKEFIRIALSIYEVLPEAFMYFEQVPDDLKYELAIGAYMHHGDSIPAVRKAVRSLSKYPRPPLPDDLATADAVTVYRAGEEPKEKARFRLSWTTDKEVALFFLNTWNGRHASHLYQGKIRPARIIAYTDDRNEKEVIQYGGVYDVIEITDQKNAQKGERGNV